MRLLRVAVLLLCASNVLASAPTVEYDDCDADFIAFIGSSAYQFSPGHAGELGAVRLFAILSYQRAAHEGRFAPALWQLRIDRVADGTRVLTLNGRAHIGREGAAMAEYWWDGRDEQGALVPAGAYRYTFVARYAVPRRPSVPRVPREVSTNSHPRNPEEPEEPSSYDDARSAEEALASSDEVVVNYSLTPAASNELRISANATSCQVQQNAPLEAGFAYNFYYGSTHAHSNWSDGGHPTGACNSGNAYGSGTFTPAAVYNYARNTAGLDFWVVNEHNHLIQDAIATNNAPVTEAKVKQRYQDGLAAANAATVSGSFVGMYGMEWGVSTNADQGHVTLIETPKLFGWETCSTCNGPSPECTPGTNCYFDVFTPKRFGYLALYAASVANPSSAGPLGIFNHPGAGEFDNFAFNANADNAMQGIAVRSGLAFATQTDCANANVGASDYSQRWKEALNKGFHVGPVADHDSHCNNYGMALPTRTVYLAPSLTKASLLAAHRARHFFASEDPNAQLVFRTADGTRVMGDIFNAPGGVTLVANVYDPNGEAVTTLEIWRGQIGGGVPASPYRTYANQSSATLIEPLTSGTYWYYVRAVQADGHDVWSSPMWITYQAGGGGDTQAPATSITAPLAGATVSSTVNVTASATDNVGVTRVEFWLDGALQSTDTTSPYAWSWNTTGATNGAHTLQSKAFDAANNSGTSVSVGITVSNGGGGGSSADVSGWKLTQANAAGTYTIPAGTVIPAEGYLIVARQADKAAFQTYWARTLAANVVFLNSGGAMPVLNGDETITLSNASSVVVDGPSGAMPATAARTMQRTDPCTSAWIALVESSSNPGSGAGAGCAGGVKLNEVSDASGTGNFIYEFVEIHNDSAAAGDTQAPATSITAPPNAATVSATVNVTASASDNVGVTKVEFWLDGVLRSTDTASPYAWSWNTTTSTNGAHSLLSKAYDAANNIGTSTTINVTVSNGVPINIGGYSIVQANSSLTYTIPAGTTIPSKGYVIIARNATKAQFQTFWGVTLAANVVFINSADTMPQINGSETYTLRNASATTIDGATVAMASAGGESLKRLNGCGAANLAGSWSRVASSTANPGSGAPVPCNKGAFISEFSDALGTGNFIYEFVELYNDK
ncbi:MAG TPA: Ig-like domain-containing protein [Thermoanaerobaculia bacterium]|nr:Ig-like domain-containing protein [Thermoanaerobaculia bacterium]